MPILSAILMVAVFCFMGKWNYGNAFYASQLFLWMALGTLVVGAIVWKRVHPIAAMAYLWAVSLPVLAVLAPFPLNWYPIQGNIVPTLQWSMFYGMVYLTVTVLFPVCVSLITGNPGRWLKFMLSLFLVVDAVWVICQAFVVERYLRGGVLFNASLNGCMMAVLYPLLMSEKAILAGKKGYLIKAILPPLAIVLTKSYLSWGLMFVSITLVYMGVFARFFTWVAALGVGLIAHFQWTHTLFPSDSGRLGIWKMTSEFWYNTFNPWVGSGTGSSSVLIPVVQQLVHPKTGSEARFPPAPIHDYFLWLHNDWLQIFQEQGLVGFLFVFTLAIIAIKKSYKNKPVLYSVLLLFVMALFNYPLRHPITSIFSACLVFMALSRENDTV